MTSEKTYYFIDSNGLIAFILNDDEELNNAVSALFNKSNEGDNSVMSSTYVLGETFKRVLTKPEAEYNKDGLEAKISKLRELAQKGRLVIKRMDDIDGDVFEELKTHMKEIRKIDQLIELGDVFNLAFVCSLDENIIFYTGDINILKSKKLINYFNNRGNKSIKGYE